MDAEGRSLVYELVMKQVKELSREDQMKLREELTSHLTHSARRAFRPGDDVTFKSKYGPEIKGVVEKVNVKTVIVRSFQGKDGAAGPFELRWHVAPPRSSTRRENTTWRRR